MEINESLLSVEHRNDSPFWIAQEILNKLKYKKSSELSNEIALAMTVFAKASGFYILPAPKWRTETKGYLPKEIRAYIILFAGSCESDIGTFAMYKDGADKWLKKINKQYIAENAQRKMLVSFDFAYSKFEKKRNMTKTEIIKDRGNCIEKYNKIFRECSEIKTGGLFFVEQLENIHTA